MTAKHRITICLTPALAEQVEQEWPARITSQRLLRTAIRLGLAQLESLDDQEFKDEIVADLEDAAAR